MSRNREGRWRVLGAILRGCETPLQVSENLHMAINAANQTLCRLVADGALVRSNVGVYALTETGAMLAHMPFKAYQGRTRNTRGAPVKRWAVLQAVKTGSSNATQIAERLNISNGAATGILIHLYEDGALARVSLGEYALTSEGLKYARGTLEEYRRREI